MPEVQAPPPPFWRDRLVDRLLGRGEPIAANAAKHRLQKTSLRKLLLNSAFWLLLATSFVASLLAWERSDTPRMLDTFRRSGEYSFMPLQNQLWSARLRMAAMRSQTEEWNANLAEEFETARDVFFHRISLMVNGHELALDFQQAPTYALMNARMQNARDQIDAFQISVTKALRTEDAKAIIRLLDGLDPLMSQFTADLRSIDLGHRSDVYDTIQQRRNVFHAVLLGLWLVLGLGGLWAIFARARQSERFALSREALEQKVAALQTAEELVETRNNVLNMVAHDLRSPLQVLMNSAEVLQAKLPKEQLELHGLVRQIDTTTEAIATHLRDLTTFAKALDGNISIQSQSLDLDEIGRQAFPQALRELAQGKGLGVQLRVDGFKKGLRGDATRITQILSNLIENAIKYTDHGTIDVMIETKPLNEAQAMLTLTVADSGVGMSQGEVKKAFQPFVRLEAATRGKASGYGLGLSLVKHLVGLLRGTLEVRSTPGLGTAFLVRIPACIEETPAPAVQDNALVEIRTETARVLVVDDVPEVLNALVDSVRRQGATAMPAIGAREALALAKVYPFDMALIDYQMPHRNGLSLAAELAQYYPEMHLVIMSAFPEAELFSPEALKSIGAHGFAEKPISGTTLRHWIDRSLALRTPAAQEAATPRNSLFQ